MKIMKINFAMLAVASLLFASCSKDDPEPKVIEYQRPVAAGKVHLVEIPDGLTAKANAGDINATISIAYMNLANSLTSYSGLYTLPSGAEQKSGDKNSVLYSWTNSGYSYWLTFAEEAGKYIWTTEYQLPGIPRFTYMKTEEAKDGKFGSWVIYDPENNNIAVWSYNWSINAAGNYTALLTMEQGEETNVFNITNNADGSGSFVYNINSEKQNEIIWNADGSGSYWLNDENGSFSGTWV